MAKGTARNVAKKLTAEEKKRHEQIRKTIQREKPELIARGRAIKAKLARLRDALSALKEARQDLNRYPNGNQLNDYQ